MATNSGDHAFNRRATDPNVAALAVRVSGLEGRVAVVEQSLTDNTTELRANTALTKQVHSNTETLVELAQSAAVIGKIAKKTSIGLKYLGFGAGGIAAVMALGKAGGWW